MSGAAVPSFTSLAGGGFLPGLNLPTAWKVDVAAADKDAGIRSPQAAEETQLARRVHDAPDLFIVLWERYGRCIYGYLYRRTMDADLAEELTAQTFQSAFQALRRREQSVWVRPWLYRIATTTHLHHVRGLRRWLVCIPHAGHWFQARSPRRPDSLLEREEEIGRVRTAMLALPDAVRTAVLLRYDEEMPYAEIAQVLRISPAAARTRVSRGLDMLEKELGKTKGGEGN